MQNSDTLSTETPIAQQLDAAGAHLTAVREAIGQVIYGQDDVVEQSLITLLAGGHGLLIGVPGLAKTLLVDTLARALGLDSKRVQFTPDLMPSDILGAEVLEESASGERSFRFIKGPVFCQLLMADEINRASPRTQSALLQAMQEQHVTIAGLSHDLPQPFHVLATQNPLEQEGTYPLPEAQLDRFLMQINVEYPDEAAERRMILATTGMDTINIDAMISPTELQNIQTLVRRMPIGEKIVDAILRLVRHARPTSEATEDVRSHVIWGPGPRAGQAFMLCTRARALLQGRLAPSLDDVRALAGPILRHRMALTYAARAQGLTLDQLIADLCLLIE